MKNKLFLLFFIIITSTLFAQGKVYLAHIESTIDLGLAPYVRRVIDEAQKNNADAIIFKINTFGGRVDAATQIKDAIFNSKVKTIAFIDKRAISAGALISLSCQKIVMAPGSSIGATTVVNQAGKKESEKYQSFMRSEMRATAEKNGRNKKIAEGMVDERVVIPGLVDNTHLITLTSEEALKYGIADTVLSNLNQVLDAFGLKNDKIINVKSNWSENFVKFLNNPIVSSLLIMIGLVGLFVEIKTPGWGIAGTAAIIALALFFGASYIVELASATDILIFIIGVILLLLEIFVIPGFGIAGALGIILMVAGLFLSLISSLPVFSFSYLSPAIIQLASTFVMTFIVIFILSKFLPKTNMFKKLVLNTNISSHSGYTSKPDVPSLIGKIGKAFTDLRPSGTAIIKNKRVDVVTEGEYINRGAKIIVRKIEGSRVIVEKYNSTSKNK